MKNIRKLSALVIVLFMTIMLVSCGCSKKTYTATFIADGQVVATRIYMVKDKKIQDVPEVPKKDGYTGRWSEYTLKEENIKIEAVYTLIDYKVTFMADGAIVEEKNFNVEKMTIENIPEVPEKVGYTGKWETYTLSLENIVVNAVYTPIEYTATFYAEEIEVGKRTFTVEDINVADEPNVPSKAHYVGAWEEYTIKAENIEINAVYTPVEYIVTFVADEEEVGTRKFTIENMTIESEPEVPIKGGYTGKWEIYILSLKNIEVNAIYTPIEYTATFYAEEIEIGTRTFTVEDIKVEDEPNVPSKAHYVGVWEEYTIKAENIEINAVYTPVEYIVTFVADEEEVGIRKFTIENMTIESEPEVPIKGGYTGKWSEYTLTLENIEVNAEYTIIEYVVTFVANEEEVGTRKFTIENMTIENEPEVPNKVGYTGEWETYSLVLFNITVNAKYTPIEYTATFKANGSVVETKTFTIEDTKIKNEPEVPGKAHYVGAWEEYTIKAENIEINAVYTPVEYYVIFIVENVEIGAAPFTIENMELEYEPEVPEKLGYTGSWEDYTLTLEDIEVNAIYTPIEYVVTFVANEEEIGTRKFTIENMLIEGEPEVPEKVGYTGSWEDYTLELDNITVNAVYTPIEYTATFKVDGNVVETKTFTIEDTKIKNEPEVPNKTGYLGTWEEYTIKAENIEINAVYVLAEFVATFKADGEIIAKRPFSVENMSISHTPTIPEKIGYTGIWESYTLTFEDIEINAIYTPIEYTATFKVDKEKIATRTFNIENMSITNIPEVPEKIGYAGAWEEYTLELKNIEIKAVYTLIEYTATFIADETEIAVRTFNIKNMNLTDIPEVPEKVGYTSVWESYTLTLENIEIKAVYTAIEYTATFVVNETEVETRTFTIENMTIEDEPNVPNKAGYLGVWEDYTLALENIKIKAVYTIINYTATFVADGVVIATRTYNVDNMKLENIPSVPKKAGYTGTWERYTLNLSDIEINADYIIIDYTVTFIADNQVIEVKVFNVENMIITNIPEVPEKIGYSCKWEDYTLDFESIEVNAVYTIINYTATFVVEGEVIATRTFTIEDTEISNIPSVPEKVGYIGKWEKYKLQAENLVINAIYVDELGFKVILTKADLIEYASNPSNYTIDAKLYANIDLEGMEWTPIGDAENPYSAEFYGSNYKISNFKITTGRTYNGLFGYIENAKIENLAVEDVTIEYEYNESTYVGGIAGFVKNSTISKSYSIGTMNVVVSSTAKSVNINTCVGGLVGYASENSVIENCYTTKDVSAKTSLLESYSYSKTYAGGLVGFSDTATIKSCYALGNVKSETYLQTAFSEAEIYAGGLVAYANKVLIENCYTTGNVDSITSSDHAYAGGLVGYASENTIVKNCYTTGNISSESSFYAYAYAGGLIGSAFNTTIEKCYATGNVTATTIIKTISSSHSAFSYAGGLVGYKYGAMVSTCYVSKSQTVTATQTINGLTEIGTIEVVDTVLSFETIWYLISNKWSVEIWNFYSDSHPTLK